MNVKSMVVFGSSTVCAISLFVSISITYFTYETNTCVTSETSGDIEAISFCSEFNYISMFSIDCLS